MPKKSGKTGKSAPKKAAAKPSATGNYRTLRLQKRIRHPVALPSARNITVQAARLLWRHRRLFLGITLVYAVLNFLFVQGFSAGSDISTVKDSFSGVFTKGLGVFAVLLGTAGSTTSPTAGAYQIFLAIITSLAVIWALRQVLAGRTPRVKDTFYQGMFPLVPFILVLLVIGVQLLPMVIGAGLYTAVINNGIALYAAEKLTWAVLCGALTLLTFYLITSSIFALYIVTLEDMTPMQALRSARGLVAHRRWTVLRKLLCLPIILVVAAGVIMLPFILVLTPLAEWVFFLLTMFSMVAAHAYVYTLYRELLNE
jgi:hypothetical protein